MRLIIFGNNHLIGKKMKIKTTITRKKISMQHTLALSKGKRLSMRCQSGFSDLNKRKKSKSLINKLYQNSTQQTTSTKQRKTSKMRKKALKRIEIKDMIQWRLTSNQNNKFS